jgi:hypothetical protein
VSLWVWEGLGVQGSGFGFEVWSLGLGRKTITACPPPSLNLLPSSRSSRLRERGSPSSSPPLFYHSVDHDSVGKIPAPSCCSNHSAKILSASSPPYSRKAKPFRVLSQSSPPPILYFSGPRNTRKGHEKSLLNRIGSHAVATLLRSALSQSLLLFWGGMYVQSTGKSGKEPWNASIPI